MRSQEGAPRLSVALGRRRQPSAGEDVPDRGGRDGNAELAQLADDPQVAPARVLARKTQDQLADLTADGRTAGWRCAYVQRRATSRRCQRSSVSGRTRKTLHAPRQRAYTTDTTKINLREDGNAEATATASPTPPPCSNAPAEFVHPTRESTGRL